ncbi:VOC family protein [Streptomyces sp. NPDC048142]|uniref:VOC family protein n=1 Tax=Streptomyces sp. NPDC048142 TaxID=3365501 RepID=UPI0037206C70
MLAPVPGPAAARSGGAAAVHLDLGDEDLDAAEQLALRLGAVEPDPQPGGERWRVRLDPAGHLFCLASG